MVRPTRGVLTFVGDAHDVAVSSRRHRRRGEVQRYDVATPDVVVTRTGAVAGEVVQRTVPVQPVGRP